MLVENCLISAPGLRKKPLTAKSTKKNRKEHKVKTLHHKDTSCGDVANVRLRSRCPSLLASSLQEGRTGLLLKFPLSARMGSQADFGATASKDKVVRSSSIIRPCL